MNKEQVGITVMIVTLIFLSSCTTLGPANPNWQKEYMASAVSSGIEQDLFEHNSVIDTNEDMAYIASKIASESINAKDATKKTLDWVYENIRYTRQTTANVCFAESSTDALAIGKGDCVSMTKIAVSLLREQGIAAKPVGGCISSNFYCGVLFSAHPDRMPQFEPVDIEDPKKRGGLHEWLEIWIPEEGWIIGEATSGQLFPKTCRSYDTHDYNTDSVGMCVILDRNYINQCARF